MWIPPSPRIISGVLANLRYNELGPHDAIFSILEGDCWAWAARDTNENTIAVTIRSFLRFILAPLVSYWPAFESPKYVPREKTTSHTIFKAKAIWYGGAMST